MNVFARMIFRNLARLRSFVMTYSQNRLLNQVKKAQHVCTIKELWDLRANNNNNNCNNNCNCKIFYTKAFSLFSICSSCFKIYFLFFEIQIGL